MKFDLRRLGRERALNLLYEADAKEIPIDELLKELPLSPDDFTLEILTGIKENTEAFNELISRYLKEWTLERMSIVDRAIIRIAACELKNTDTPTSVILNEAVELSKEYSTENSGRFVNGMLASIAKELRPDS